MRVLIADDRLRFWDGLRALLATWPEVEVVGEAADGREAVCLVGECQPNVVLMATRMGWSRTAWRLFLIKLLIGLPMALAFLLLFVLTFAPLLLWATESKVAGAIGTVTTIGLFFPILFLAIVVGVILSLLTKFFWRA